MSHSSHEPRNWFYALLNAAMVAFALTAFAYAVVPVLERRAAEAGRPAPPSALRAALREDGWLWLLAEAAAVTVLALASMGLDRWRQSRRDDATTRRRDG
jgi:hypothetical protein